MYSRVLRNLLRGWSHNLALRVSTLATLAGSYTVLLLFGLSAMNLQKVLLDVDDGVEMAVYLDTGASSEKINSVRQTLTSNPQVKSAHYISKEEAARQFESQLKNLAPGLMDNEDYLSAFPPSFEIQLTNQAGSGANASSLAQSLAKGLAELPGVEDVVYGQAWLKNYKLLVGVVSTAVWGIGIVLILGCFFIVGSAVKSFVYHRRHEVEVLEMIGATDAAIRFPFLIEGGVFGLICSLLSVGITALVYSWLRGLVQGDLRFTSIGEGMVFFTFWQILLIVALGIAIGLISAQVNIRNLNTGWAASKANR